MDSSFDTALAKVTRSISPDNDYSLIPDSLGKEPLNMKPSILIVDDVIIIRNSLTEFFCRDYTVYQATNGREAIKMLGENKDIELVLSDVNMPEMDGMELLEKIRSDNNDLVVILMTAFPAVELLMDAKRKGAYCCLSKPFDLTKIDITIKNALREKRRVNDIAYHLL